MCVELFSDKIVDPFVLDLKNKDFDIHELFYKQTHSILPTPLIFYKTKQWNLTSSHSILSRHFPSIQTLIHFN
jgi:hypothetical protein